MRAVSTSLASVNRVIDAKHPSPAHPPVPSSFSMMQVFPTVYSLLTQRCMG